MNFKSFFSSNMNAVVDPNAPFLPGLQENKKTNIPEFTHFFLWNFVNLCYKDATWNALLSRPNVSPEKRIAWSREIARGCARKKTPYLYGWMYEFEIFRNLVSHHLSINSRTDWFKITTKPVNLHDFLLQNPTFLQRSYAYAIEKIYDDLTGS